MKSLELSNLEIADLCRELALLLHAGVRLDDGLYLLAEGEKEQDHRELMSQLARSVQEGNFLSKAFADAGCFPVYVTGLLQVGERVGRMEESLNALSRYYEEQEQTDRRVRSALTYPAILLLLMLVVIVVLLSRVLPVFNEVYASLGEQLTGVGGGLLLGQGLDRAMPVLCALLAAVMALFAAFSLHRGFRGKVLGIWRKCWGDRGVSRKLNDARFAQALSMGLSSGLPLEEAVEMAALLLRDVPTALERCKACGDLLEQGESLAHALGETGLLSSADCRLLTLGMRGGTGDHVMEEIARRMSEDAQLALESKAAKIEPMTSVLVGAILNPDVAPQRSGILLGSACGFYNIWHTDQQIRSYIGGLICLIRYLTKKK